MALRLLPFRQYDEQDVINMFALKSSEALESTTGDGQGSNGVFVKVLDGNFNQDTIQYGADDSYLGKTNYPHVGGGMYPSNPLEVEAAGAGEIPLGLTLNQTAKADENGEKLLYNTTKKEELQAVLPGQSVPVATKGVFTLASTALAGGTLAGAGITSVGGGFVVAASGQISGSASTSLGMVIGTGTRNSVAGNTDAFAGNYVVIKLG